MKQYSIIHISKPNPNQYLLIVDETAQTEVQDNGWCLEIHEEYPSTHFRVPDKDPKYSWWFRQLNMAYLKNAPKEFAFYRKIEGSVKAVIAHLPLNNSPVLEGVDLLPELPQDEKFIIDINTLFVIYNAGFNHGVNEGPFPIHGTFNEFHNTIQGKPVCDGSVSYSIKHNIVPLSKSNKKHTGEDLISVINEIGFVKSSAAELNSKKYQPFITDENGEVWTINKEHILSYIQSLSQVKIPIAFEAEYYCTNTTMEEDVNCPCFESEGNKCKVKVIDNIWQGKYLY